MVRVDYLESANNTQGSLVSSRDGSGSVPAILVSQWPLASLNVRGHSQTESSRKCDSATSRALECVGRSSRCHCAHRSLDSSRFRGSDAWQRSSKPRRLSASHRGFGSDHGCDHLTAVRTSRHLGLLGSRALATIFAGHSGYRQRCNIRPSTPPAE
jgi:hypothetical protein